MPTSAPHRLAWLGLLLALLLFCPLARAFTPPALEGHVIDLTHTLTADEKSTLEQQMTSIEQGSTVQIAVLVLPSLGGEPIDDVGYSTAKAWHLGQKHADNGVLLVVATGDRRIRIEVGKGLEGRLTDLQSNDIIKNKIGPAIRDGSLYKGLYQGVDAIAHAAAGDYVVLSNVDLGPEKKQGSMAFIFIAPLSMIVFALGWYWLAKKGKLRGTVTYGAGISVGGFNAGGGGSSGGTSGGGSSGGGGGGFSGGGGDFGGGGSSGSY
jgi:uncharacterized protein